jgi:hypothetical protein
MKLISIFVSDDSEEGVWSIHLNGESQNEFDKFFDQMNDPEWLHKFLEKNKADLNSGFFGNITIEEAVLRIMEEAGEMENTLYDYSEEGFTSGRVNLQNLFKPLNNLEYTITIYEESKARIGRGWLRLYAIRRAENCYLVTEGAVKMTQNMKRTHLQNELKKSERTKRFLRNNGISYPEDLNNHQDE